MDSAYARRQVSLSQRDSGQWLDIQKNTFTNWVNECLRSRSIVVEDIGSDLSDGVNLVYLVEGLARQNINGAVARPSNQYEKLQNITMALELVSRDGVKIVNIDSSDIMDCNLKLVLALIWQLILKYQVGLSTSQNRTWILTWLRAVIPDCSVANLTTDWNDGILLHALLDFCKPGVSPNWRTMDRENRVENCRSAMKLARQHFNVPLILRPEDLASAQLDDRSFITYLSYFIRVGGPGYDTTLERVASRAKPALVTNFTTDFQDGYALTNLVRSAGGVAKDGTTSTERITNAMDGGREIGVEPLLEPYEISTETTEHLGNMAYGAQYLRYPNHTVRTFTSGQEHLSVSDNDLHLAGTNTRTDLRQPLRVTTEYRDESDSAHTATIQSPQPKLTQAEFQLVTKRKSQHGPRVELPPLDQLKVDVYSVGIIMESKITGSFDPEKFKVEAKSPCGRIIRMSGNGHYAAQFNVNEIGRWDVSMTYDGHYMDGCPIDVCDPSQVTVRDLRGGLAGKSNTFLVDCSRAGNGDLGVDINHNGRPVATYVSKTSEPGVFKASYTPFSKGPYEVNVHFNRAEIREVDFHTFDPEERSRRAVFNTEVEPKDGYVEIKSTCDWEIDYITGGPFICQVNDSDDIPVYAMSDGTVCGRPELIVDLDGIGEGHIEAEAIYQGRSYPCKVKRDKEKPLVYRVRFKPRGPGTYKIWINYEGRPIKGCPFTQHIAELEGPSAHGDGLYRGVPGKPATFVVDPKNTAGEMAVNVSGPSKPVVSQVQVQADHTVLATFFPTERGPHKVTVRMDGKDIKGSPFSPLIVDPVKVRVSGGWRPLLDDTGIIPLKVNKEKVLPFDVSEAGPGELTSEVQGPNGKIPVVVDARHDGKHSVVFTPREEGKHYIHVNWGGYPLSNSPYLGHATHSPDNDQVDGFPNVRLVQVPLQSPTTYVQHGPGQQPTLIHSPGSSVAPSSVDGPLISVRRGREQEPAKPNGVVYLPSEPTRVQVLPGRQQQPIDPNDIYARPQPRYVHIQQQPEPQRPTVIRYQQPLPQNQVIVYPKSRSPPSNGSLRGPQKVVLLGKGLKEAEVDKPAEFKVDGTKADPGSPTIHLESIRHIVPVKTEPIRPNVYKCTYVPKYPGAYLLYVNWNGKPLKGSPFKVNILDKPRPQLVMASREPQGGVAGKDYEMSIDTRHAGQGNLAVKCTDPLGRDVPTRLNDNPDGTRSLKVTPKMPGRHIVEIRYNGEHIMGSPYAIDIKTSQVKGNVKVWGPGIEDGVIPRFQSTFWVETTGAGAGDLRVRIMGPKGAFHVKMRKASQKDKIYQCFYDPVEPGVYTVHVQWSGVHVDGSPFTVLLGGSMEEVERMRRELQDDDDVTDLIKTRSQNASVFY